MMSRGLALTLLIVLALFSLSPRVWSHGGGLDGQGGHHDRKNGGYHFHRGLLAGQRFSSKTAATAALSGSADETVGEAISGGPPTHDVDELDLLIALLEEKGVLEPGEYDTALRTLLAK